MESVPGDKLISVREAAKECGRNPETIRRWIWSGKLPAEKLGNQLFVKRENLLRYLSELNKEEGVNPSGKQEGLQVRISGEIQNTKNRVEAAENMRVLRNEIKKMTGTFDIDELTDQPRGSFK